MIIIKIEKYLNKVFAQVVLEKSQLGLYEEILSGALERRDDYISKGVSLYEAEDLVVENFGNVELFQEELDLCVENLSVRNKTAIIFLQVHGIVRLTLLIGSIMLYFYLDYYSINANLGSLYINKFIIWYKFYWWLVSIWMFLNVSLTYFIIYKIMNGFRYLFKEKMLWIIFILSIPNCLLLLIFLFLVDTKHSNFSILRSPIFKKKSYIYTYNAIIGLIMLISTIFFITIFGFSAEYVADRYYVTEYSFENNSLSVEGYIESFEVSSNLNYSNFIRIYVNFESVENFYYNEIVILVNQDIYCIYDDDIKQISNTNSVVCEQGLNSFIEVESIEIIINYNGSFLQGNIDEKYSVNTFIPNLYPVEIIKKKFVFQK